MLVDDFISDEQRPHSVSLGREVRIRIRSVRNSKSRPGREGHRNLVVGEVSSSDLATEENRRDGIWMSARIPRVISKARDRPGSLERAEAKDTKGGKEVELTEVSCSLQHSTSSQQTRRKEHQESTPACSVRTRGGTWEGLRWKIKNKSEEVKVSSARRSKKRGQR